MKITDITTYRTRIDAAPWFYPRPIPKDHVPYWEFPFTVLHTDEGIDGYTMDYGPLGQGRGSAYLIHDVFYHDLVGKNPLHHEKIWQSIRSKHRHLYNIRETIWSNLDVALWDIKGKVAGLPVVDLLGRYRSKVPAYATCPPQTITSGSEIIQEVGNKISQGFRGVKLQLSGGPERDIPLLEKAREVAGSHFPLMLDSSAVLSFEEALQIGHALDDLGYQWFEEPIPDAYTMQLRKLTRSLRTPVLAAETVGLFELPRYIGNGNVDMVRGDVHHKGGITGLMKALGMCEMMGVALEIHTASSPLLDIANLHVGCATRMSRYLESHHPMFRFGLKGDPLGIREDGCQHCPDGPGLGVEIDWDWIENHTVEIIKGCQY